MTDERPSKYPRSPWTGDAHGACSDKIHELTDALDKASERFRFAKELADERGLHGLATYLRDAQGACLDEIAGVKPAVPAPASLLALVEAYGAACASAAVYSHDADEDALAGATSPSARSSRRWRTATCGSPNWRNRSAS